MRLRHLWLCLFVIVAACMPNQDFPTRVDPTATADVILVMATLPNTPTLAPEVATQIATSPTPTSLPSTSTPIPTPTPILLPTPDADALNRSVRLPILMYHYVEPWPADAGEIRHGLTVRPEDFAAQMQYLHERGYVTVSLYDLVYALALGQPLPERAVALTFDDGYRSLMDYAVPTLQAYGYTGTVFDTHVIDLTPSVEALWRDARKGHKSAIKAGQKAFTIEHWAGQITDDQFRRYQELHALAAGRVTRSQSTFDTMRDWIRNGQGLLAGARQGERWIGFVYMLMHQRGAFYASACNYPDTSSRLPVGHALLWEAILRCRERGIELLEMGLQTHAPPQAQGAQDKLVTISLFKRGFGGFAMPRYHAHLELAPSSGAGVA